MRFSRNLKCIFRNFTAKCCSYKYNHLSEIFIAQRFLGPVQKGRSQRGPYQEEEEEEEEEEGRSPAGASLSGLVQKPLYYKGF